MDLPNTAPAPRETQLREIFPKLTPLRKVPGLFTLNGCGTSLAGKRDHHAGSGSYVTTQVLTILWIPVLPLAAYRVIPAGGNHYHFLGREPLSNLARRLRWLIIAGVAGWLTVASVEGYFHSDGYLSAQRIRRAQTYLTAGSPADSATEILPLCGHAARGRDAVAILQEAGAMAWGKSDSAEQALAVARLVTVDSRRTLWFPDLGERLHAAADRHGQAHPREALELLQLAIQFRGAAPAEPMLKSRGEIARRWWQSAPNHVGAACAYAAELEADEQFDEIRRLLTPFKDSPELAGSEAARLLGGVLFRDGEFEAARKLLKGYIAPRMREYHAAEQDCARIFAERQQAFLDGLNRHEGPPDFYQRHAAADEAGQTELVDEYLAEKLRADPEVRQALDRQEQAGRLVPAVMQLGMAELNLSRDIADAKERQNLLRSAEQTFLSIRGAVGETDEFRLFLGEISYWLGKHQEGRRLFDELLASHRRASEWMLRIADRLRDVGEVDGARTLLEEAWAAETDAATKQTLAGMRQVMYTDSEDRQQWLLRCDSGQGAIKAELHANTGEMAQQAGRIDEAKAEYRLAITEFESLPESASRLNNEALVWQRLALLTGSAADFRKSVENIARASRLEQSSILLENLGTGYLSLANWEANERLLDLAYLPEMASTGMRPGLAGTPEEYQAAIREFDRSPHTAEARKALAQALVMSPKNPGLYATMVGFQLAAKDPGKVQELLEKIRASGIDHSQARERAKPYFAGKFTEADRLGLVKSLDRQRAALMSLPAAAKPATRTMLEVSGISLENALRKRAEDPPPVGPLLDRARALQRAASCATTVNLLVELLSAAAVEELRQDPAVAAIYQTNRWQMDASDMVTALLAADATAAATARHPLVVEAVGLLAELSRIDGDEVSLRRWFWTSKVRPADAGRLLELIKGSAFKQAINQLEYEIAPYNPESILYRHLLEVALGRPEAGRRILDAAAADGIRIFP